jgi:hypothetical protein
MAKVTPIVPNGKKPRRRPALTPEARENQMIALAVDLVEQRLIDGTASSQETTHFLKLASTKARLEKEKLQREVDLMIAKTEAIKAEEKKEEFYSKVLDALKNYNGLGDDDDY